MFADASEQAFASVAYPQSIDESGSKTVAFVAPKSTVAPPRLELQAAVLATRLKDSIMAEISIKNISCRIFDRFKDGSWLDLFKIQKILFICVTGSAKYLIIEPLVGYRQSKTLLMNQLD